MRMLRDDTHCHSIVDAIALAHFGHGCPTKPTCNYRNTVHRSVFGTTGVRVPQHRSICGDEEEEGEV